MRADREPVGSRCRSASGTDLGYFAHFARKSALVPVAGAGGRSQMTTWPVPVPVAMWPPFGANATCVTGPAWRMGPPIGSPVLAWVFASLEQGAPAARSAHLLYAMLNDRNLSGRLKDTSPELARVSTAKLATDIGKPGPG
jgi:hypothetical protein